MLKQTARLRFNWLASPQYPHFEKVWSERMRLKITHPKDFWSGLMFVLAGLAAILLLGDLPVGRAGKMGPAYFPTVLGALLCLIGAIAIVRSMINRGEPIARFYLKELILVSVAVVCFGLLIRNAGLVPAIFALILISAYASPQFSWRASLLSALLMSGFAVLLFVKLLALPIPVLRLAGINW